MVISAGDWIPGYVSNKLTFSNSFEYAAKCHISSYLLPSGAGEGYCNVVTNKSLK